MFANGFEKVAISKGWASDRIMGGMASRLKIKPDALATAKSMKKPVNVFGGDPRSRLHPEEFRREAGHQINKFIPKNDPLAARKEFHKIDRIGEEMTNKKKKEMYSYVKNK